MVLGGVKMASNFTQHIDTAKLNDVARGLRTFKTDMDNKVEQIDNKLKQLESDYAYQSQQSEEIKAAFNKFMNTTKAEFDKDMEAFSVFIEKVSQTHKELAQRITQNIATIDSQTSTVASKFNS